MKRDRSIEIEASATTVWTVFSDVARWPEWTASVERVVPQDGPDLRVGARGDFARSRGNDLRPFSNASICTVKLTGLYG